MPVKVDKGLLRGPGIGDWRKQPLLSDLLRYRGEKELVEGPPEPTVKLKHAKEPPKPKEKMIKVRMVKDRGEYKAGKIYKVPESFARFLLNKDLAKIHIDKKKGDKK